MSKYTVVIEKGENGYFIAHVPSIPGCHTQAKSIDELMPRVKEAIELCLEEGVEVRDDASFVEVRVVEFGPDAKASSA